MKSQCLESNIWKFFIFNLTQRRHYVAILSIFFLTLPDTTAKQIGIYSLAGYLASFILEIPSGYLSDRIGHKKILVLSKILLLFSILSFIYATSLIYFIIGSVLFASSAAFESGTTSAFMHNTFIELKREKEYVKIMSKISANASLVAAFLILILPFTTKISIVFPLKINFVLDVIGLFVALSFVSPKEKITAQNEEPLPLKNLFKKLYGTGFYLMSVFLGIITGFVLAVSPYNGVYLQSLGFPVIFIGVLVSFSRVFMFFFGHFSHVIEKKIGAKDLIFYEIFFFTTLCLLISLYNNPYLVGLMIVILIGYYHARKMLMTGYFLDNFCVNDKLKATMLSINAQIESVFQAIAMLFLMFLMNYSYKIGYFFAGVMLFVSLSLIYIRLRKRLK